MKTLLRMGLLGMLMISCSIAQAKKFQYKLTIYKIIYNGDTLQLGGNVVKKGVMKKHTKRLSIATLDDGSTLHLEMWLTVEGVMLDKFNVFQHKYYTFKDDAWTLLAVSPRLKFMGRHYDRGHYTYNDPRNGESLEVFYELTVDPYKKKKKK